MREMKASGISWLGELPSNWELRKIKYCLQERVEKNNPVRTTEILSLTAKQVLRIIHSKTLSSLILMILMMHLLKDCHRIKISFQCCCQMMK